MKVEWDKRATNGRDNIADYICEQFGYKRKIAFLQEVRGTTKMLKQYPNMGAIDPLFANRSVAYRSIIVGSMSKMVYFVK